MIMIHAFLMFTFGIMALLLAVSIRYYFRTDTAAKWPRFLTTVAIACGILVCAASIAVVLKHGCCNHGKAAGKKCNTEQCETGKNDKSSCKMDKCDSEKNKEACCADPKKKACTCPPDSKCGGKCDEKGHEGAKKCEESGACGGACAGK